MTHKWSISEREEHWTDVVVANVSAMHTKNAAKVYLSAAMLMIKLTDNILDNPDDRKYREVCVFCNTLLDFHKLQIKLRNPRIRDEVLKCDGAEDALIGMGWTKRVIDMEEKMFWDRPDSDFERLKLGKTELVKYVSMIREKASDDPKERERREREEIMKVIHTDKEARLKKYAKKEVTNPAPCPNTAPPVLISETGPKHS
eukprot:TRINITY_DN12063_c0_g1_i2.p1 TRINITY_DN12063_c0_g1~~TRINITY_DN12063_c0_g1_i2.p1  ORF type:complete len:201 (+),score=48.08 TRINITY_DN12063_c0_g1_i2:62-664(+)